MISFDNVTKEYPDGTVAVREFSHRIDSRTACAFVGTSGSGKTTLLRMVNRMVDPTSGSVLVDGEDVAAMDPVKLRRRIGYVMQASGLLPHRTVQHNIATVLLLNGMDRRQARSRALEMMELVGLDTSLAERYPAQLSGGQQQRVGVARALAPDPNILLMDEPFGAVDPIVRRELQHEMTRIQSELAKTIIFVTHDIDEAMLIGDSVVLLRTGGQIAQAGPPEELLTNPADAFTADFVGGGSHERELTAKTVNGRTLLFDADGKPAGVLRG
ncbi:ABC transporter ATP-binding protein [Helcobacillus massiliensis]|uniref:ABC-type quaternary amine transporter n=1 Tax=Helcobacillus massiliensis TaxID=521392 RepID=A0A839QTB0_9MICO|nr:ATP-binding cassette domain-containing protein [Helcobacillus massiliensis]MBB3023544.1 osmoprotectant transport system ATP-binding protein [Helcobacillus massiliensis]